MPLNKLESDFYARDHVTEVACDLLGQAEHGPT